MILGENDFKLFWLKMHHVNSAYLKYFVYIHTEESKNEHGFSMRHPGMSLTRYFCHHACFATT